MKDSKREAYINTISKFQPKYTNKFLGALQDKDLSTLYKNFNVLPSIIRTQPKNVKSFRRKLYKNKDVLFLDIGALSCIREQDNNSFELKVTINCSEFASEVKEIMNYNSCSYVHKELDKLFSDSFQYEIGVELDVNETGFWGWNKYNGKESECFMYLIIVLKALPFSTKETTIFTGQTLSWSEENYYNKFYYALRLELDDDRCGYLSRHIIGNNRSNVRFATRLEDLNIYRRSSKKPSVSDFFNSSYNDFKYIKKAELIEFRYKHIISSVTVIDNYKNQECCII